MRVIVNLTSTLKTKTGVGHYTEQLFRCLRRQAHPDRIDGYPPRGLTFTRACWARLRRLVAPRTAPPPAMDWLPTANEPAQPPRGWRQRLASSVSRFGCNWLVRHERSSFFERGYDVYHEPNFVPLPSAYPTISTFHDLSALLHPHWHPAARVASFEENLRLAVEGSQAFVAVSEFTRREMIRVLGIAPERITRIYNGVRPSFRPLSRKFVSARLGWLGLPHKYLLYVGTIEPRKNLMRLLHAHAALPVRVRRRWPLVLAGSWGWNAEEVREYYETTGRHRNVLHLGYVAEADLPVLYNGARALVYPSLYEGFGLPPMEMLACGGAVLASTADALVETVGPRAHLVHAEDLDGWRLALERITADDEWWLSLRHGSHAFASSFTWERSAAEHLSLYRAVAGGKAATPHAHLASRAA